MRERRRNPRRRVIYTKETIVFHRPDAPPPDPIPPVTALECGHEVPGYTVGRYRACPGCGREAKRCVWTYDETHCAWDSSCGEKWILMDGGPSENKIRFCHGCGKPVEVACEAPPEKAMQVEGR